MVEQIQSCVSHFRLADLDYIYANDQEALGPKSLQTSLADGITFRFSAGRSLSTTIAFNMLLGNDDPQAIRIAEHWKTVVHSVTAQKDFKSLQLKQIAIVGNEELHLVLSEWSTNNHPESFKQYMDGPRLLHAPFDAAVQRNPHGIAMRFVDGDHKQELTYKEVDLIVSRGVRAIHRWFQKQLLWNESGELCMPERFVGLLFPQDGLEAYLAVLSVLKSGCGYVPIDPAYPTDRLAYIVNVSVDLLF